MGDESFSSFGKGRTVKLDLVELDKIVAFTQTRSLQEDEFQSLCKAVRVLGELSAPAYKNEKAAAVGLGEETEADPVEEPKLEPKPKPPASGRKKPADFVDAATVTVADPDLKSGQLCPCGCGGRLYLIKRKQRIRRFTGRPPIEVTFYELEKLRCNKCEAVFTAPLPEKAGEKTYEASAVTMLAIGKYASGQPFYRQAGMLGCLGVPIAASTQYEVLAAAAANIRPAHTELIRLAAQVKLSFVDDTWINILLFKRSPKDKRTGIHTTGVVSVDKDFSIGLFFTGAEHAGENMGRLLNQREPNLPALIQMSDALSRNFSNMKSEAKVIHCCCLTHGRRNFVKIAESFPMECRYVIKKIGAVYHIDKQASKMDEQTRMAFHRMNSGPIMGDLHEWFLGQFEKKLVEPNSQLGKAIQYMLNHWHGLTQFLRVPGAPLDSNTVERALKTVILNRKNSLFYRTANGALTGDLYMSLIYTCKLNKVNPFNYLTELQRNAAALKANPGDWMPWTYLETLRRKKQPSGEAAA